MILGFFEIYQYKLNLNLETVPPNSVTQEPFSTIGDLSALGLTYSREVNRYYSAGGALVVFDRGTIDQTQSANFSSVCATVVNKLNNIINYNTTSGTLVADIQAALGENVTLVSLSTLPIVSSVDQILYPSYIIFTYSIGGEAYTFKIWLSGLNFLNEYPLGSFNFVTPVSNLLNLYENYGLASSQTTAPDATLQLLSAFKAEFEHIVLTGADSFHLRVFNKVDTTQFFDLPILVGYNGGATFCNQLNYFNAFKELLLSLGSYTIDQWATVIPELVPLNEYFVNVNWRNVAVDDVTVLSPYSQICSPTISAVDPLTFALRYFPGWDINFVTANLNYTVALYKSVGLYILPNFNNRDGGVQWGVKFYDYFIVPTSDINIQQMSVATQSVYALLDQLIRAAEIYQPGQPAPLNTTVVQRGNFTYISQIVGNTKLTVLTRSSEMAQ